MDEGRDQPRRDGNGLDLLMREAAELRRSAVAAADRYRQILAENRRMFRHPLPNLAVPLSELLRSTNSQRPLALRPAAATFHGLDTASEEAHLARADQHIAEAEARVVKQRALIDELQRDGHDVVRAEELVDVFIRTLSAWYSHRTAIAAAIASAKLRRLRAANSS